MILVWGGSGSGSDLDVASTGGGSDLGVGGSGGGGVAKGAAAPCCDIPIYHLYIQAKRGKLR